MSVKPYQHTVYVGGYTPTLHKKGGTSTVRAVECYSCVREGDASKAMVVGEFPTFRVGDQVNMRHGSERGTVTWVSDCKTHIKVRTTAGSKDVSKDVEDGPIVEEGSNGHWVFRKDRASKQRQEGRLVEHAWRWQRAGPDITVKATQIKAQQIEKEKFVSSHPTQYIVRNGNNLTHSGNEGDSGNKSRTYELAFNKYQPDEHAAGRQVVRTQGVRRVSTVHRDNGDILGHGTPRYLQGTQSSRGKERTDEATVNSSSRFDAAAYSQKHSDASSSSRVSTPQTTSSRDSSIPLSTSRETPRSARPVVDNGR